MENKLQLKPLFPQNFSFQGELQNVLKSGDAALYDMSVREQQGTLSLAEALRKPHLLPGLLQAHAVSSSFSLLVLTSVICYLCFMLGQAGSSQLMSV